jgi:endonuclease-3
MYPESLKDPERIEEILRKLLPPEEGSDFCHRIVWFGREVCTARSPKCEACPLRAHCAHFERLYARENEEG